ncbi:MAG: DUF2970 domain-containing protein [Pseudomonadales bacterium]|nr:DUF2970 domain-containing protein [Pseudomonadales bacterium]
MSDESSQQKNQEAAKTPGFRAILMSTLAAGIGIQSNKNRERDFTQGNIKVYAVAGLIFTVVFISSIVILVKWVINSAGM